MTTSLATNCLNSFSVCLRHASILAVRPIEPSARAPREPYAFNSRACTLRSMSERDIGTRPRANANGKRENAGDARERHRAGRHQTDVIGDADGRGAHPAIFRDACTERTFGCEE